MITLENDVSWHVLRRILRDWAGTAAELEEVRPLAGGSINSTLLLTARDGLRAVLKVSSHRVNRELIREAHQLRMLHSRGIPVPLVFADHLASLEEPDTWVLMEYIPNTVDLHAAKHTCTAQEFDSLQEELADLCCRLHHMTDERYHREGDSHSPKFDTWCGFFHHVYDGIWQEVRQAKTLPPRLHRQMARLHKKLERLLPHDDPPRLTHGDLWSANILVRTDGARPWTVAALLDPNLKFAHAEAELAYLELFHTVTPAFLKRYARRTPISDSYREYRRDLYQAYDLLDHVHLFGQEYVRPLSEALAKLDKQ